MHGRRWYWVAGCLVIEACSHARPVAVAPVPSRQVAVAEDSAVARGSRSHSDSVAAAARASAALAAAQQQAHADSIRNQVQGESGMETAGLRSWGLAPRDSEVIADRVHFGFNVADLTEQDVRRLEEKRQVLEAHPTLVIQVQGNCDERGSDEYNLALGERRAAEAKRWLVEHGVAASRISIVSYGEEHPLDPGHTEEAWARNRRADFVVTQPAN